MVMASSTTTLSPFFVAPRLLKAVALINSIEDAKFALLVSRILQKIHLKDERIFSEEEEMKLQSSLSLKQEELKLVLEMLNCILQQITYNILNPEQLGKQLEVIKLNEKKTESIVDAWTNQAKHVIENLRKTSVETKQLESVNWRFNLSMGQSTRAKLKQPIAQFDLGISSNHTNPVDHVFLEFNHQELFGLYSQLEQIQTQLDYLR